MAQINVIGSRGGRSIDLDLPEVNPHVLHEVVTWQLAGRRRGTASTKTRAEVSRTGKKMYSQKGTGNARHGDRSVPTFVGGGVAFAMGMGLLPLRRRGMRLVRGVALGPVAAGTGGQRQDDGGGEDGGGGGAVDRAHAGDSGNGKVQV